MARKKKKKRGQQHLPPQARKEAGATRQPVDIRGIQAAAARAHRAGELDRAARLYHRLLSLDPDNITGLYHLGIIAHQTGRPQQGLPLINKVLSLRPSLADAHNIKGLLLFDLEDFPGAANSFRLALAVDPEFSEANYNLANAAWKLGDTAAAITGYRKAIRCNPRYSEAFLNLGMVCAEQGELEEAEKAFRGALAIQPDLARAHHNLSKIRKYSRADDPHIQEMENLISNGHLSAEQKMHLCFALGKACEDAGEYQSSFRHYREGNRIRRTAYNYHPARVAALFAKIKKVFDSTFVSGTAQHGRLDRQPIFILGMPRSGTSLVEQILACHSEVHGAGELYLFQQLTLQRTASSCLEEALDRIAVQGERLLSLLGQEYIEQISALAGRERFVTDKMPQNFLFIGLIRLALPGAVIIHCRRNPMDTCCSIYTNYFASTHEYAYDLTELGQYYLLYDDLMHHWETIFPGSIYTVHYEKLVADQAGETRRMLEHLSLPWQKSCLVFHQATRRVATASSAQVRRPLYAGSIGRWKKFARQLAPLSDMLAPCSR
jgi:tetratricopeptide (TPR) repeat protein